MLNHAGAAALETEVEALKKENRELKILVKYYEEQFLLSKKRQFAASSEKSGYDQLCMDDMTGTDDSSAAPRGEGRDLELIKSHYRKKKRTRADGLPDGIPVEEVVCELPAEERACPGCGAEMEIIGNEYREELVVIPATVKIRRYAARTYVCKACSETAEPVEVKKAGWPNPVIKGSFASPESVAYAAHQKFAMGVPLYRQEQEWRRFDVLLPRQTMANWLIRSAEDWLVPIVKELKRRLLLHDAIHTDETTFQVLKEPGKRPQSKSYLWCYRTGGDAAEPAVVAQYKPDRRAYNPVEFLRGYSGYLHADGYDAYHKLPAGITVVGCWAHVRRKWDEALKIVKKEDRDGCAAMTGKQYCDRLFSVERELAGLDAKEKHSQRLKKLKPLMDEFFAWAADAEASARPKSPLGVAISYMFSQQQYLRNVLLDGRLELSNNRAERTIKPFVISRKNFLFADTQRGADAAAAYFSLIETAKETGVNPFEYLTYVLKTAPNIDINDSEQLGALLPAAFKNLQPV